MTQVKITVAEPKKKEISRDDMAIGTVYETANGKVLMKGDFGSHTILFDKNGVFLGETAVSSLDEPVTKILGTIKEIVLDPVE